MEGPWRQGGLLSNERWPVLKMTFPGHRLDLNPTSEPSRSWLLLGGILPVEYDDVRTARAGGRATFPSNKRLLLCDERIGSSPTQQTREQRSTSSL